MEKEEKKEGGSGRRPERSMQYEARVILHRERHKEVSLQGGEALRAECLRGQKEQALQRAVRRVSRAALQAAEICATALARGWRRVAKCSSAGDGSTLAAALLPSTSQREGVHARGEPQASAMQRGWASAGRLVLRTEPGGRQREPGAARPGLPGGARRRGIGVQPPCRRVACPRLGLRPYMT